MVRVRSMPAMLMIEMILTVFVELALATLCPASPRTHFWFRSAHHHDAIDKLYV
ncbi:hypothetical protein M758_2G091300 [Ceratodon purpureus]|nr:hypothetical protein M758_2G091300 [Ceratodon purpureus]